MVVRPKNNRRIGAVVCAFAVLFLVQAGLAQKVNVRRKPLPVATVRDPGTIQFFMDQFFLPVEEVDSIDFIDVDENGFTDRDVMVVYPTEEVFNLTPSEAALDSMRKWEPTAVRVIGMKNQNEKVVVESKYNAAKAMFAGLIRLLEKNYAGNRISLLFDYNSAGESTIGELMVWGYREEDLEDTPNPLEQFAHDLIIYERVDTVYVEKPVYDIIYIEHSASGDTTAELLPKGSD